jgi:hypothetical protein
MTRLIMNPINGSGRFLHVTSSLGAVDVRCTDTGCILVFAAPETDDDKLDAIRVLARTAWPGTPIMVGRRSSLRETGTRRIVRSERAFDGPFEWKEEETG